MEPRPPRTAAHPRKNELMVNVRVTWEMLQPNCFKANIRNTLQEYAAPKAIWRQTPATAIRRDLTFARFSVYTLRRPEDCRAMELKVVGQPNF